MSKPNDDKATESLGLSDQQRNNIVTSFIFAYMDSKVTVDLTVGGAQWDAEFLDALSKKFGVDPRQWSPRDFELALKEYFGTRLKIASGNPAVPPEEKRKAMNELYDFLVNLRIGNNLKGKFIGVATLESKLAELEKKVKTLDESLYELRLFVRAILGSGGSGGATSQ